MSTPGRRKNSSVIDRLAEKPYEFSFSQAVRLLERSAVHENKVHNNYNTQPVARFTPPQTETIRFKTNNSLNFKSSDISKITCVKSKKDKKKWDISVNFMGLTGAQGVLPYHYTELILSRHKIKDKSLSHFLDLFNHRTISLFYQASNKYNLPIEYERKKLSSAISITRDNFTQTLLSLIGLGTEYTNNRLYTSDESLFYYSGLLSQKIRTASGLKQILSSHFKIPVEIKEFVGQWQELIEDVRTRLPGKENPSGQNNCLGRSIMLGRNGWFAQGKINIILGPLTSNQLKVFSPGTDALKALNEIVQLYAGLEYSYDFIIRVRRSDIPEKIQLSGKNQPIIGWNTWLSSKKHNNTYSNEMVDIKISSSHFN